MNSPTPTKEGYLPFRISPNDSACSTFYKIIGDLWNGSPAVIVLHGGPGAGHEYLLPFAALWPRHDLPVIFYDQIGCAASTHLPHTAGDESFWTEHIFISELKNLIDGLGLCEGAGFHLVGHSWGAMLAAAFAATQPRGLRKLVLASGVASMQTGSESVRRFRERLPAETKRMLEVAEQKGEYDSPHYQEVLGRFFKEYMCRAELSPPEMELALGHLTEDKTVYGTMYGPSTLMPTGSLRDWTCIPRLSQITVPCLVYNGEYDSSDAVATLPFCKNIPNVRWTTFGNTGHMCHLDGQRLRQRVIQTVGDFLTQADDV